MCVCVFLWDPKQRWCFLLGFPFKPPNKWYSNKKTPACHNFPRFDPLPGFVYTGFCAEKKKSTVTSFSAAFAAHFPTSSCRRKAEDRICLILEVVPFLLFLGGRVPPFKSPTRKGCPSFPMEIHWASEPTVSPKDSPFDKLQDLELPFSRYQLGIWSRG